MDIINVLSGPVVGAVIGYFTNYVAVKMLFRPKNPVKIGGYTLPFTPGMIPKRKDALAKAIGRAVEDELFGAAEIKAALLADGTRDVIVDGISGQLQTALLEAPSVKQMISEITGEAVYIEKKEKLEELFTDKVVQGICNMDIGQLIVDKGTAFIGEKMSNPLLSMFVTPDLIQSIAAPIGDEVVSWVQTEGKEKLHDYVQTEMCQLEAQVPSAVLGDLLGDSGQEPIWKEKLKEVYTHFVESNADQIAKQFRIREIIESRIANMSNDALEELVLSVMKNELGMIVNLGALIGAVIGVINIFL